jgi:hypothetical protein
MSEITRPAAERSRRVVECDVEAADLVEAGSGIDDVETLGSDSR